MAAPVSLPFKMETTKVVLKHKGTISSDFQVLPKSKVRAIFGFWVLTYPNNTARGGPA